jgi:hypothetical protein
MLPFLSVRTKQLRENLNTWTKNCIRIGKIRIELHTVLVMRHYWSKVLNALALKLAPWTLLKVYFFTITNVQPSIPQGNLN